MLVVRWNGLPGWAPGGPWGLKDALAARRDRAHAKLHFVDHQINPIDALGANGDHVVTALHAAPTDVEAFNSGHGEIRAQVGADSCLGSDLGGDGNAGHC